MEGAFRGSGAERGGRPFLGRGEKKRFAQSEAGVFQIFHLFVEREIEREGLGGRGGDLFIHFYVRGNNVGEIIWPA